MRTKAIFSVLFLSISTSILAGVVELPMGGELLLDSTKWNVQSLKFIPGSSSMMFASREREDVIGYLWDGSINTVGQCHQKTTPKKVWSVCVKDFPVNGKLSRQVHFQRSISKGTFQNYVIAFNLEKNQREASSPLIENLKKEIGGKK